jgi:hypothetical protein
LVQSKKDDVGRREIDRVQTGVRIERRILQVLKALAESHRMTLGDLVEGIVLHAFEGAAPFGPDSLAKIAALKEVYGLDLDARDSHLLVERKRAPKRRGGKP